MLIRYDHYKSEVNIYLALYNISHDYFKPGELEQRMIFGFFYQVSPETLVKEIISTL